MRRCRPLLGTFVEIETDEPAAFDAAFFAVDAVHRLMSAHEPASELSLVNRSAQVTGVEVSEPTAAVLARALQWSRASQGRFDIVRAGSNSLYTSALPLHPGQPFPDPEANWKDVLLEGHAVRFGRPACLDLGGIAKGFAVDRAIEAMIAAGATRGLVNAGGDLRVFGQQPWPIDVVEPATRRPVARIDLHNMALATSAGLPSEDDRLEYGHLLHNVRQWTSVTVRAASACDADALTKILWAGAPSSPRLLRDRDATAFAIHADGLIEEIVEEVMA
jgi:thiamine biosynthesis lipoprotein